MWPLKEDQIKMLDISKNAIKNILINIVSSFFIMGRKKNLRKKGFFQNGPELSQNIKCLKWFYANLTYQSKLEKNI